MEYILAIESSCDETAMCIINTKKEALANVVNSQAQDFSQLGGVVPELASRKHVDNIYYVFNEVLSQAQLSIKDINYIAITVGPGLIGSLLVGVNFANMLSHLYNIPILPINHMQGHIYAVSVDKDITFPHLSLIISGGHTELVYLKKSLDFELIGMSLDDALGECFDKVARTLGLEYPGGPKIEALALKGKPTYKLPIPKNDQTLDFSFSGLKSACFNQINSAKMKNEEINQNDFCASFMDVVNQVLSMKLQQALDKYPVKSVSVVGGVSCNKQIQKSLQAIYPDILIPPSYLSTDNALMIGLLAVEQIKANYPTYDVVNANPSLNVEQIWPN